MIYQRGDQIAYLPLHTEGNIHHPDVEFGFVMSRTPSEQESYFCRYWVKGELGNLRTRANSEATPADRMRHYESVPQMIVDHTIEWIERQPR